jgi:hypothetical protein
MGYRLATVVLIASVCFGSLPGDAVAQTLSPVSGSMLAQTGRAHFETPSLFDRRYATLVAETEATRAQRSQPNAQARDSLGNGAIIGALVGGLALGALGGTICKIQQEAGGPSCVPDTLRIAAIGAAIGVGIGIGIDAALTRSPGVSVSIRTRF